MLYKASAPGSLMLLGEYAVLEGHYAIVAAIDRRIHVRLTPRDDHYIKIYSPILGHYTSSISALSITKPFQFVLAAIKEYQSHLKQGCDIEIQSDFSDKIGFGSSAAVTVAMLSVLQAWLSIKTSALQLISRGTAVIQEIQGEGSGADIAASVCGGIVVYCRAPLQFERFAYQISLVAHYAGYKTPTADAIAHVRMQFKDDPARFKTLMQRIGQCTQSGINALREHQLEKLGACMNEQQQYMESLGVSTPWLSMAASQLRNTPHILGAKISGAGLGDCVVGLSTQASSQLPVEEYISQTELHPCGRMAHPCAIRSATHIPQPTATNIVTTSRGVRCERL